MATTQSQYRREEHRVTGQPAQTTNWDDHLDGLLTELKDALPGGRGSTPQTQRGLPPSTAASADLSVPYIPGSEDFHERREYTSPDHRTHTVEERSRHTERADGRNQVVSRQMIKSHSSSRTTETSTGSPEPLLGLSGGDMTGLDGFVERTENFDRANSNAAPARHDLNGSLSAVDMPVPAAVPGTQSHVTRYEYRSSQRSVSPAAPRRQPPPTLPKPRLPAGYLNDASTTTTTTERPPTPSGATTINYHIYNYSSDGAQPTDSGVGTLERTGPAGGRLWHESSLERQVVREGTRPAADRVHTRTVTNQERTATPGYPGGAFPVHGETLVTRVERGTAAGCPGSAPFPVETQTETGRDAGLSAVQMPSEPQDGTYPDGPRRRELAQVTEVRSAQEVTEPPELGSDGGQTPLTGRSQSQSQSQSQGAAPGVYYPPEQMDCETKFHSKESGKHGNTITHFEASGKYKAKGGSKQKEAKGGKTVPVCLPCCAGAACTIM